MLFVSYIQSYSREGGFEEVIYKPRCKGDNGVGERAPILGNKLCNGLVILVHTNLGS